MTHTPTPWKVERGRGYHCGRWVITAEGMPPYSPLAHVQQTCGPEESYHDAQFIIRACNAHEELVAALRELVAANNAVCRARMPGVRESPPDYATLYESIHRAQAVLAKVEAC